MRATLIFEIDDRFARSVKKAPFLSESFLKVFTLIFLTFSLLFVANLSAGEYREYNFPFFFGRQPSARSEAMGGTLIADQDHAFTPFYNPAPMVLSNGINAGFAYASPFYGFEKANFTFLGATYQTGKFGYIGLYRFHFSAGQEMPVVSIDGTEIQRFTPTTSLYGISYAKEIFPNAALGLSVNFYRDMFYFDKTATAYPVDAGFMKLWKWNGGEESSHRLVMEASVKNVFGSKVTVFNEPEPLPVILRAGSSYQLLLKRQEYLRDLYAFGITVGAEYQDILNYDYHHGVRFGAEISAFQILNLRVGYYSIKLNTTPINGKERLTDFTYGFGVNLPLKSLTGEKVPLALVMDITNLKQPTYITDFDDWDNFTVYGVNLRWER